MSFLSKYGQKLLDQGYPIIPIKRGFKYPRGLENWQTLEADKTLISRWLSNGFSDGGVGILTARIPAIDLDIHDKATVARLVAWCDEHIGLAPRRTGMAPKTLLVFRTDEPFTKIMSKSYEDMFGRVHRIEILGQGQQFVAYADHPITKRPYTWDRQPLADTPYEDLPVLTPDDVDALIEFFESIIPDDWTEVESQQTAAPKDNIPTDMRALAYATPPLTLTDKQIETCLNILKDKCDSYADWVKTGMALHHQFGGSQTGYVLWDEWSQHSVKYRGNEMAAKWRTFGANLDSTRPTTFATVLKWAKEAKKKEKREHDGPFRLMPMREILARLGPVDWRIEGFLEKDCTGILYGAPGSYKSFIAIDMSIHIAMGKAWHGQEVQQGPVIYIAGEGHGGFARRTAAWQQHYGEDLSDIPMYFSERAAHFYDEKAAEDVINSVDGVVQKHGNPGLIVIDTLARNMGTGDENSTSDMGVFIDRIDTLRQRYNTTVLVVHHTGHSHKNRARGSGALQGGIHFSYRTEKAEAGMKVRMVCDRMKEGAEPEDVWFEGQSVVIGDFKDDLTSLVFTKTEAPVEEETPLKGKQLALYELIEKEGPNLERKTLYEIALEDGSFENKRSLANALKILIEKEKVTENDNKFSAVDDIWG